MLAPGQTLHLTRFFREAQQREHRHRHQHLSPHPRTEPRIRTQVVACTVEEEPGRDISP
ncbi:hypothetical protein [Arthrobacter ulcerisalmonis]|uniref:hypothetical protein n=1 Tax=Arthrobacter ulcerisalmonis TaxID=2483813 RepID=UPI00362D9D88